MCGIVGIVSAVPFGVKDELLPRLKRLEYRGYDSAGFATSDGVLKKSVGEISRLMPKAGSVTAKAAISHTRWATHGGVTEANAHPHTNVEKDLFIVHNGIIENCEDLRRALEKKGRVFETETDSEAIAHFFAESFAEGMDFPTAAQEFLKRVDGTFAVLILRKGEEKIYALKRDSPLVLGIGEGEKILASDIYAFSDRISKAVFFEDDEFAEVTADGFQFYDREGKKVEKKEKELKTQKQEEPKPGATGPEHYMIREIKEQPAAVERLVHSLQGEQSGKLDKLAELVKQSGRVVFTAAGTSYFATLLGAYFLNRQNVMASTFIASEFENYVHVDKNTLVVAVSQSGETMDVVAALKYAKAKGATVASFVNTPYSTVERMSAISIDLNAGQEICVAATKTFTNEVVALVALAQKFDFESELDGVPQKIRETIEANEAKIKEIADSIADENDVYILGRGISYPSAREFAHKMKEIAYVHAEGMMGGELKHGTLALVGRGTPVIALIAGDDAAMMGNTREVQARNARVITVSSAEDADIRVPESDAAVFAMLSVVVGQLFAYYIALKRGLPIDKPRNLAKSVTVK